MNTPTAEDWNEPPQPDRPATIHVQPRASAALGLLRGLAVVALFGGVLMLFLVAPLAVVAVVCVAMSWREWARSRGRLPQRQESPLAGQPVVRKASGDGGTFRFAAHAGDRD
jgi:hypothetical protein